MSPAPRRQPMITCPHCRRQNDPARGSDHCWYCRRRLDGSDQQTRQTERQEGK